MKAVGVRHVDLFSGIGGFALAAGWAGFTTVQFVEIDPFCRAVLRKHWPDVPIHDDIRTFTADLVGRPIDLITGGVPCQPFSVAGKRRGQEDDRHLWPEMARVIGACRPRWVLGENVPGFISLGLDDCLADLESLGYEARAIVVPACAVNAPHRRDRVWIVAHRPRDRRRHGEQNGGGINQGAPPGAECGWRDDRHIIAHAECVGWWKSLRAHAAQRPFPQTVGPESASRPRSGGTPAADVACERPDRIGEFESGLRRMADGLPNWMDGGLADPPAGLAEGVPHRGARLKALGNAVVPAVAFELLRAMREQDDAADAERDGQEEVG